MVPYFSTKKSEMYGIWATFPNEPALRAQLLSSWLAELSDEDNMEICLHQFNRVADGTIVEAVVTSFPVRVHVTINTVCIAQTFFPNKNDEELSQSIELSFPDAMELILKWRETRKQWQQMHPLRS